MVSSLTTAGLTIDSKSQIVADLVSDYQAIYGNDINVDSNSPDGQLINIYGQSITDMLELLIDTYNSFSVPTAYGVRLDQLVALNGLQRQQGTYTVAQVQVVITQALTLPGLDQTSVTPFTVEDDAGNQYQLITSYVAGGAVSPTLSFQAVDIGVVQTTPNTITNIITSTLGVSSVNNPSVASDVIGVNEESDAQLKVRHAKSFSIASTGPSDSMESALKNVPGVTDAFVVENNTGSPASGIPAYGIWIIVNGGTNLEVGQAIYAKKSPGCPMKSGGYTQLVARPNGTTFTATWDAAIPQTLYVKFSVIWAGPQVMANSDIISQLQSALVYKLGENPSIADVLRAMAVIAPTAIVSFNTVSQGVSSDNANWGSLVSPDDYQHYFGSITVSIV